MKTVFHDTLDPVAQKLYPPGAIKMVETPGSAYGFEHRRVVARAPQFWDTDASEYRHDVLGAHEPQGDPGDETITDLRTETGGRLVITRLKNPGDETDFEEAPPYSGIITWAEANAPDPIITALCGEMGRPIGGYSLDDPLETVLPEFYGVPGRLTQAEHDAINARTRKLVDALPTRIDASMGEVTLKWDDDLDCWVTSNSKPIGGDLPQGINRDGTFPWRLTEYAPIVLTPPGYHERPKSGPGDWIAGGPHPQPYPEPAHQIAWSEEAPEMPDEHPVEDAFELPRCEHGVPVHPIVGCLACEEEAETPIARRIRIIAKLANRETGMQDEVDRRFGYDPDRILDYRRISSREYHVERDEFTTLDSLSHWGMH